MNIAQVIQKNILIQPNTNNIVEKTILNYKILLEKLNHTVNIKCLNDITENDDIIHIHDVNLAIEANKRGISYIFSLYNNNNIIHNGKKSNIYIETFKAIKNSIVSITYDEDLVDFFGETNKLFYLPQVKIESNINYINSISNLYESVLKINREYTSEDVKKFYINNFETAEFNITTIPTNTDIKIIHNYICNPRVEILGKSDKKYTVKFFDEMNNLHYENVINSNMWCSVNRSYYIKWRLNVLRDEDLIYSNELNLENKRVLISFESKSLGDTLAWIPYCEEFKKKHNCDLIVSTFFNYLFANQYTDIEFVDPGKIVYNIYAQYNIGLFYNDNGEMDLNKNLKDFMTQPLQKAASDILGLDYKEIKPRINFSKVKKKKKVGIGFHSTLQGKYWNNSNGWQDVVNYLKSMGYECMVYSNEKNGFMGNYYPRGVTLFRGGNVQEVINDMSECEFFIGVSSGLSWVAWALNINVIMISGITEVYNEFKENNYRVINENICHGCFNKYKLDKSDWNWCPIYKGTDRQFECTKQITSEEVIKEIDKIIEQITSEEVIKEIDKIIDKNKIIKSQNKEKNKLENFNWGEASNWYIDSMLREIGYGNMYNRLFDVEKNDIVVDLGASIGPFTYSILSKNPKQCYVVEPMSKHIELLKKNVGMENVKIIQGAITDKKYIEITWEGITENVPTFSFKEFLNNNNISKIDFLKCDCEGGEYDVFQLSNIEFLKTIPKIVVEFHMDDNEYCNKSKFKWFRDNILLKFDKYEIFSTDGVDIKWDLWNTHFIEYYNEVIIYIKNY